VGRVNSWLLRRLDQMSPPEQPLPPKLEAMRTVIEKRMSRVAFVAVLTTVFYSALARMTTDYWWGLPLAILAVFVGSWVVMVATAYQGRKATREYVAWLRAQPPTHSRMVRMGAPYERRPPVADVACQDCPALPGARHDRTCPAVPPQWYRSRRNG
jgi:hypothetical protein